MDFQGWVLLAVFLISLVALLGFFCTKTRGFKRFSTSTLLLLLVVGLSAIFFAASMLPAQVLANIFFAVIGFAGGLFTGRDPSAPGAGSTKTKKSDTQPQQMAPQRQD